MKPKLATLAALALLALAGCTTFEGELLRPDGSVMWRVKKSTAPLISRKSSFEAVHEWLDEETNTLHTATLREFSDERADAQAELIKALATMAASAPKGGGI